MRYSKGNFSVFGCLKGNSKHETQQFQRVIASIERYANEHLPFAVMSGPIRFTFKSANGNTVPGASQLVLFTPRRIITYTLYPHIFRLVDGNTTGNDWKIMSNGNPQCIQSLFLRASRQRKFVLQHFLKQQKERTGNTCEFVADARVVLPAGSDFSAFRYSIPKDLKIEKMNELARNTGFWTARRLKKIYCNKSKKPNKMARIDPLFPKDQRFIDKLFTRQQFIVPTARWFKIMDEAQFLHDLKDQRDFGFELTRDDALRLANNLAHVRIETNKKERV